jgi:hypothetical protein
MKTNKSRYIQAQRRLENLSKLSIREAEEAEANKATTWKAKIGSRWFTGVVNQMK